MTIEELNEKIVKQQAQLDDLNEKIVKQQALIDELKNKVLSRESTFSDFYNAINRLSNRISDIENNGIKTAVGDLQDDMASQRLKINKLDRIRKGLA
nr:MAG TPA: SlyX [Caudoviricetes sp.]